MKEIRVGRPCNAKHWNVCNPETRYATLLWISSCQNTDSGMWVPPRLKNGNCFKSVWCPLPVPDDAKTGMRKPECENLPGVFDAKTAECEVREPGTPPCFGFCITKSTGSGMYWVSRNLVFGNWFLCDRYHPLFRSGLRALVRLSGICFLESDLTRNSGMCRRLLRYVAGGDQGSFENICSSAIADAARGPTAPKRKSNWYLVSGIWFHPTTPTLLAHSPGMWFPFSDFLKSGF